MTNFTYYKGLEMCTTDYDDGLFVWAKSPYQPFPMWCQIEGTCDFTVKGLAHKSDKIIRYAKMYLVEDGKIRLPRGLQPVIKERK